MASDLTVVLENRPGTLAELGEALGRSGINIRAMAGAMFEGQGAVHVLVDNPEAARSALESAGMDVRSQREVLLYEAEDRPGMLGEVARTIADAGVNIDLIYKATQTQLVIGADDLEKARAALK